MEGRCRIGSKRGGQQSPQQLRGLHGNLATDHLRAPVNTTLNVLWKLYLPMIPNWDGGGGGKAKCASKANLSNAESTCKHLWNPPHIGETADQHWLDFNFA